MTICIGAKAANPLDHGRLNKFRHTAAQRSLIRLLQRHQSMMEQMRLDLQEPDIIECLRDANSGMTRRALQQIAFDYALLVNGTLDRIVAQREHDYEIKAAAHRAFEDGAAAMSAARCQRVQRAQPSGGVVAHGGTPVRVRAGQLINSRRSQFAPFPLRRCAVPAKCV